MNKIKNFFKKFFKSSIMESNIIRDLQESFKDKLLYIPGECVLISKHGDPWYRFKVTVVNVKDDWINCERDGNKRAYHLRDVSKYRDGFNRKIVYNK